MPKIGWQSDLHGKMNLTIYCIGIGIGVLITLFGCLLNRFEIQPWNSWSDKCGRDT